MSNITFAKPELFYLLLGLIPMIVWYVLRQKKSKPSIQISSLEAFRKVPLTWKHSLRHVAFVLQLGVLALIIVCLNVVIPIPGYLIARNVCAVSS